MVKLVNKTLFALKLKAKHLFLFSAGDIRVLFGVSAVAAFGVLHRYTKQGFIVQIKRGLYGFPDALPPDAYIANTLCSPSYVSREFALSYHRVIPETVYELTSVTTKSTRRFETLDKIYSYRTIKQAAYTGYAIEQQNGFSFQIADPEKAFVDTSYFRMREGLAPLARFDTHRIDAAKALRYAQLYGNAAFTAAITSILK